MTHDISQSNTVRTTHLNPKHKDTLFRMIFSDKKDLLTLYNAVNGTDYQDSEALTICTLEDAIYMDYKNDISFLFEDVLSLYEHQSTLNPNMPLRGLIYFARNYEAFLAQDRMDIHSSVLQKLPVPQYFIFYNGLPNAPERQRLSLEDAFIQHPGKVPCLTCEATLLNINYGKNRHIMERCQKLQDYSRFIAAIRSGLSEGLILDTAVNRAVDFCINHHILQNFLVKHRAEVKNVILSTFDQENHDRIIREHFEQVGFDKGTAIGELKKTISIVQKKLVKNFTPEAIADILEEDLPTVQKIAEAIRKHPKASIEELSNLLYTDTESLEK